MQNAYDLHINTSSKHLTGIEDFFLIILKIFKLKHLQLSGYCYLGFHSPSNRKKLLKAKLGIEFP